MDEKWYVAPSYEHAEIKKIDEENHKAYIKEVCPRCSGLGIIVSRVENGIMIPIPVDGGVCYQCNGDKYIYKWVKAYTEKEYTRYTKNQERAKERRIEKEKARIAELDAKAEENKAALLEKFGFDVENPTVYLISGNTFEIKDWIKERGGRYNPALNWYFTGNSNQLPEGYEYIAVPFDDLYDWYPRVKRIELKNNAKEIAEAARIAAIPESKSEWVGEVKQRMRDLKVTLSSARACSSAYGTSIMFTFDYNGNTLIWFTSCPPDEEDAVVGNEYLLTGTVKKHDTYRGVKQTYLNRCILKEVC
jgi:hypothetical protein